jgi:hypothetical protein
MPDDLDSQEQLESKAETEPSQEPHAGRSFGKALAESLLDLFNPFEALCEPELVVAALVIVAAAVVIGLIGLMGWGLWAGAQEVLLGGGPPQGLGLK